MDKPRVGLALVERYNISLPPEINEWLRKFGNGNLSAGIRRAAVICERHYKGDRYEQTKKRISKVRA